MFSPVISVYNSENVDGGVQRKPSSSSVTSRKPFFDIPVNSKSPDLNKLSKHNIIKPLLTKSVAKSKLNEEKDLDAEEYTFSFKEIEDYDDMWGKAPLNTKDVIAILRNYCDEKDTPPPSPEPQQIDVERFSFDLPVFEVNTSVANSSLFETEDVDLPSIDFDELDMSC